MSETGDRTAPTPPARAGMKRRFALAFAGLTVFIVAVTIALGLAEFAVRMVAPQQLTQIHPEIWMPDDGLGYRNRPNVRTTVNTGERDATLITDDEGFRVGASGAQPAETNVLLIGDSFMQALQVNWDQSFPHHLEGMLSARLGHPVRVWDGGVNGFDADRYLLNAERLLPVRHYDLMLVSVYLGNDVIPKRKTHYAALQPAKPHRLRVPRSLKPSEWIDAIFYPINDFLDRRSQLFVLLKHAFEGILMRLRLTSAQFPDETRRALATSTRWDTTAVILAEMDSVARAHGTPAVFMLIPSSYQVYPAEFTSFLRRFGLDSTEVDIEQPNRLLGEAMRRHGLDPIDVMPAMRQRAPRSPRLFGTVDRHLSPAGHTALSEIMAPVVAARLSAGSAGQPTPQKRTQPARASPLPALSPRSP